MSEIQVATWGWLAITLGAAVVGGGMIGLEVGQRRGERDERRHWHNQLTALYRSITVYETVGKGENVASPTKAVIRNWLDEDPDTVNELEVIDKWREEQSDRHDG